MFTTQSIKSFPVVIAAAVLSAAAMATPAQAADSAVPTSSVMNQSNSVYQETLKFYLHPARLEVIETPASGWTTPRSLSPAGHPPGSTGRPRSSCIRLGLRSPKNPGR